MSLPTISTRFTELFGLTIPIAAAPMSYATTPALVAEVIKAGGLGFLGAGNEPAQSVKKMVNEARDLLEDNKKSLVGVGYVGWVLDRFNSPSDPRLDEFLKMEPAAVWFAFGNDLLKYVQQVRDYEAKRAHKTKILVNVNTVEEAITVNGWNVDVIIVQGEEAGGRGSSFSPSTAELLSSVRKAISSGPIILAAGGVMTGQEVASMLKLGADGVVLGTRLLFTEECAYSKPMKTALVEADGISTGRSPAYDIVFPPGVWPKGIEARCINNKIVQDFEAGNLSPQDRKKNIESGAEDYLVIYAGTGVGKVKEVSSTATVIKKIHEEAAFAMNLKA